MVRPLTRATPPCGLLGWFVGMKRGLIITYDGHKRPPMAGHRTELMRDDHSCSSSGRLRRRDALREKDCVHVSVAGFAESADDLDVLE